MAVAHDSSVAVFGLQIGVPGEKRGNLGLDRLGKQSLRAIAQHGGGLVVEGSWLNQPNIVIRGHGISLRRPPIASPSVEK